MLLLDKEETMGIYKELRKKKEDPITKGCLQLLFTILAEEFLLSEAELLLTQPFTSAVLPVLWLTKFVNPILQSPTTRKLFAAPSK